MNFWFSEISRLASDELFNAMAFYSMRGENWTFSFVGIQIWRDCSKEQERNYWCKRSALFQVCNISTSSVQREENFNEIGFKRLFPYLKSERVQYEPDELISQASH